ncbi:uncharacterized protein IL334_003337 [Kwoniella shivajii]|uniref:Amino acid permease/ SLC12A domain-containing protein n=1 Tax=Kwoniella shivajii TaxID=564305 RepID=A0ABZ1CXA3_9TREE|nr:hypothetical protein IL334_003337 [Kwoniella shivajii]
MQKQSSLEDAKETYPDIAIIDASQENERPAQSTSTVRGLTLRHIQLIGIGSTIGTGLFLGCGRSLISAGPLGSLLAYMVFCAICWGVCLGAGEMGSFKPVPGGFITWAGDYIDPAAAFAVGWNYFYAGTMFGCADIVGVAGLFGYWLPDVTPAAWITMSIVIITALNCFHVKFYGESEFYFASLKIILIVMLILMTFIVMLGGNPQHDRIGFRYWKEPGPWAAYHTTGPLGRFLGFWNVFKIAAYSVGGPEFVSMCAGEAAWPRRTIPKAVKGVLFRLTLFFFFGILACGILVPYNDPILKEAVATGVGANASAYVVGMKRVGIKVLPDVFNAMVITSALSCANGFAFVGSRVVHSLAVRGQAPKIFARTTKNGVPIYAFGCVIAIFCLCYMQVSTNAATIFGWFINLSSVAQLLNYIAMTITTIRFRAGLKAQGIDRNNLPWTTKYTVPYSWFCVVMLSLIVVTQGWVVFTHGGWDTQTFLTCYFGLAFVFVAYFGWKLWHKTKIIKTTEMDFKSFVPEFDALDEEYRAAYKVPTTAIGRFLDKLF